MKLAPFIPASPEVLIGYCGPIEWAMLDAPGDPVWRRAVWGPIGPSSEPERMGVVNAGDMRGNIAMRLPLAHPLAMCHAARWLAGRLGMDPGSTAPRWYRQEECGITIWILEAADGCTMFWTPTERCYLREYAYIQAGKATGVDGISDLTDAAESLAAACVAVGAAPA